MPESLVKQFEKLLPADQIKWVPKATTKDKTRAFAVAYIQKEAVQNRLDAVAGDDWECTFEFVDTRPYVVICRLSISGTTREDVGTDEDALKAVAQAFKRAGAQWGIGRYVSDIPGGWAPYDAQKKRITQEPSLPRWAVPGREPPANRGDNGNGHAPSEPQAPQKSQGTPAPQAVDSQWAKKAREDALKNADMAPSPIIERMMDQASKQVEPETVVALLENLFGHGLDGLTTGECVVVLNAAQKGELASAVTETLGE